MGIIAGHIHPHSILSGTLYVEAPTGSGAIRFEDPRLPMMMAAPVRRDDAPEECGPSSSVEPRPGLLLMWESWLRHEVLPGRPRPTGSASASISREARLRAQPNLSLQDIHGL